MMQPTVLLTRPQPQAERFARHMSETFGPNLPVVLSPLIRIEPLDPQPDVLKFEGIILTSESAVSCLPKAPETKVPMAYCVGDRTAHAAQMRGYETVSAQGSAKELIELLADRKPKGHLIHLRGEHARGDIASGLAARGLSVKEVVGYRQIAQPLTQTARTLLAQGFEVIVPLFSPRTAKLFLTEVKEGSNIRVAALSSAIAEQVEGANFSAVLIAEAPNGREMMKTLGKLIDRPGLA